MTGAGQSESHLNIQDGHGLLGLAVVSDDTVHGLRNEVEHKIQVQLIFLWGEGLAHRQQA